MFLRTLVARLVLYQSRGQSLPKALTAQGVRVGQRVVFVDEMRVGLMGQVRRRWTVRGVKLCQWVERLYKALSE